MFSLKRFRWNINLHNNRDNFEQYLFVHLKSILASYLVQECSVDTGQ